MPTYEFNCKGCGNRFSLFTTVSGRDKALCPKCGNKELQQIFKGVRVARGSAFSDFMPNSMPSSGGGCAGGSCGGCSGCN
jgi:putative FmdB family regulatory protein